jgi:predicted enzyme related to lactoylglutathione lyase
MIRGAHFLLYSADPAADRAFFRDVLRLAYVDEGEGWLIFRLPDAEAALHPAGAVAPIPHGGQSMPSAVLYLMCDDLVSTMRELADRGARFAEITDEPWGRKTCLVLPGGGALGLYQPSHALAIDLPRESGSPPAA